MRIPTKDKTIQEVEEINKLAACIYCEYIRNGTLVLRPVVLDKNTIIGGTE